MIVPVISLIVAMDEAWVIGQKGGLPWRIPEDLKWFKANTLGKPCIMGRKTWESLPRRPLPGRTNIVVTRDLAFVADGAVVVHSLERAVAEASAGGAKEIMVIGGAEIYRAAMPLVQRMYLTRVDGRHDGDAHFPAYDPAGWRVEVAGSYPSSPGQPIGYSFLILERKESSHDRA
jgi:dihydrofolate reductase